MPALDESLIPVFDEVVKRNPGEDEFHQAVREVFESLGPVIAKHPEYAEHVVKPHPQHLKAVAAREKK